jgi:hypothetical protein
MADVTGDSPQAVAFRLLELIAASEGKPLGTGKTPEKKWLLDTYKECINTVLDIRFWGPQAR